MNAATRQSKTEAAISDAMVAFQHEFVGRGPDRVSTRGRRSGDRPQLRRAHASREATRQQLRGAQAHQGHAPAGPRGRALDPREHSPEAHGGRGRLRHSDISTKSGEWLDVFVLDRATDEEPS